MTVANPAAFTQGRADHSALTHRRNTMTLLGGSSLSATQPRGGIHPAYGNRFLVTGSGVAMSVTVGSGLAMVATGGGAFAGAYNVYNDADVTLTIDAADATQYRRDIIVVRVEDTAYGDGSDTASVAVVKGTLSASSPAPLPTVPDRCEVLAYINVDPAITNLTGKVSDQRSYISSISSVLCSSTTRPTTPPEGTLIQESDSNRAMSSYINGGWRFVTDQGWQSFTPGLGGWTGVTFSLRSGRWKLVGERAIAVHVELVCSSGGTGTIDLKVGMPKTIARTVYQHLTVKWLDDSRAVTLLGSVNFVRGSSNGSLSDSIALPLNDTTADLDSLQGNDVGNNDYFWIWGVLETTD